MGTSSFRVDRKSASSVIPADAGIQGVDPIASQHFLQEPEYSEALPNSAAPGCLSRVSHPHIRLLKVTERVHACSQTGRSSQGSVRVMHGCCI